MNGDQLIISLTLSSYRMWTLPPCSHHVGSLPRVIPLVLMRSKAPTNANPMPPMTGGNIGDQLISAEARVASTSNFVSTSEASQREDTANLVFLQVSSSNLFSDLSVPGNSQAEKVTYAPAWDGTTFTSQPQWDDSGTSVPVGISEITP